MPDDEKKDPKVMQAKARQAKAVARWSRAVPAEAEAFTHTRHGDQLKRMAHFLALSELAAAGIGLNEANDELAALAPKKAAK